MYESPIKIIAGKIQTQIDDDIYRAVQNVGINVDKDELLKALEYDRGQYEKGYNDAIYDLKINFFCELSNRVCRPIFSKQLEPHFTVADIKSIFEEIAEQLRTGEQNG